MKNLFMLPHALRARPFLLAIVIPWMIAFCTGFIALFLPAAHFLAPVQVWVLSGVTAPVLAYGGLTTVLMHRRMHTSTDIFSIVTSMLFSGVICAGAFRGMPAVWAQTLAWGLTLLLLFLLLPEQQQNVRPHEDDDHDDHPFGPRFSPSSPGPDFSNDFAAFLAAEEEELV